MFRMSWVQVHCLVLDFGAMGFALFAAYPEGIFHNNLASEHVIVCHGNLFMRRLLSNEFV